VNDPHAPHAPPTAPLTPTELTRRLKGHAARLGFDHCRIAPIGEAPHAAFFEQWVSAGRPGEMGYLATYQERRRAPVRHSPVRDGAAPFRSVIVLGAHYSPGFDGAPVDQGELPAALADELPHLDDPSRGRFAAYAWGDDYHERLRRRLYALDDALRHWSGRSIFGKALVDTGPVLERDWAARAGVGFFGKNCCIIHPIYGSWLFLATLLVPEELVYDEVQPLHEGDADALAVLAGLPPDGDYGSWVIPLDAATGTESGHVATCGRCTRCLDACPTQAFVGPYHLDPQRCISYWTIETQSPIPRELRPAFGNRIFGCDICQQVCPWNHRLPPERRRDAAFAPQAGRMAPPLLEGFRAEHPYWLDEEAFAQHFAGSPVLRATRAGMLRNVCVALGNEASAESIPALARALADPHPAPRGHAAWALGRLRTSHPGPVADKVKAMLHTRLTTEEDAWVRSEILDALAD